MSRTDVVAPRDLAPGGGELAAGARAMAPMIVAFAPFGLLVGAAVSASDSPAAAWLSTWTIYGGAAHLAVLDVLQRDAGVLGAVLVGLLINARMVAYSVSLAPHWRDATTRSRLAAAAMLTDATWALAHNSSADTARARRRFYFGAGVTLWFAWPVLVSVGVLAGGWFHGAPVMTLLPSLTLGTLAVRQLRTRPGLAAGVTAAAVAGATIELDSGLALGLAAAAGAGVAVLVNRRAS
jgi:predicted branched-subunit amino acid permease